MFSGEELNNLLENDGLEKIIGQARSQLQISKGEFLKANENRLKTFCSPEAIDNRILIKFWKKLQEMKCNYLCPWCGMPCCGTQDCNKLYVRNGLPSSKKAETRHTCQFHRDSAITGTHEIVDNKITDRSPNKGDCPRLIEINMQWKITDPANKNGPQICVPSTYYDTTWYIKSREENPDQGSGYFWQWFLAFVSYHLN